MKNNTEPVWSSIDKVIELQFKGKRDAPDEWKRAAYAKIILHRRQQRDWRIWVVGFGIVFTLICLGAWRSPATSDVMILDLNLLGWAVMLSLVTALMIFVSYVRGDGRLGEGYRFDDRLRLLQEKFEAHRKHFGVWPDQIGSSQRADKRLVAIAKQVKDEKVPRERFAEMHAVAQQFHSLIIPAKWDKYFE